MPAQPSLILIGTQDVDVLQLRGNTARRRQPQPLDVAAIEDDERLNAIVDSATSEGRTTPRLGHSLEGSPQDALQDSDDSALAALMGKPSAQHLTGSVKTGGVLARLGDDMRLTGLLGPTEEKQQLTFDPVMAPSSYAWTLPNMGYSYIVPVRDTSSLQEHRCELDAFQCSAALTAYRAQLSCQCCYRWQEALDLFSMEPMALQSTVCCNSALGAWALGSHWSEALELLGRCRGDVVSCSCALSACAKAHAWQAALALMQEMMAKELQADEVCYNTLIAACGRGGQWLLALEALQELMQKMHPSNASFSSAISACEKAFRWEQALVLLEAQPRPQLSAVNAAISACEKCSRWQEALLLFEGMPRRQLSPDRISFNAVLRALPWRLSLSLLAQMPLSRVDPDGATLNTVISVCEKALQWQVVLELLQLRGRSSQNATDLHHEAWRLARQPPTARAARAARALARSCRGRAKALGPKELVSLLRSFASMLVTDHHLLAEAEEALADKLGGGVLQTQELANLAWACSMSTSTSSGSMLQVLQDALVQRGSALLQDCAATVRRDPRARDFAEGMLGVVWSLHFADLLSPQFLNFARAALHRLCPEFGLPAPGHLYMWRSVSSPQLLLEAQDTLVVLKPAGWQVDDASGPISEDVCRLSGFVQGMAPLRRFPLLGDDAFGHGFLHRLDVPTSGLILVATNHRSFYDLRLQLASGSLLRDYTVLCHGFVARHSVRAPVHWWTDGRDSSSSVARALSLLGIRIGTGRKHQIRVHLAHVGHAVVRDGRYSSQSTHLADAWCPQNFLHRSSLRFTAGRYIQVAELSRPFDKAAEVLGKISQLRSERDQRNKDLEILHDILGPGPSPSPSKSSRPGPQIVLRARKVPVVALRYQHLQPGSLCYFASIGDATSVQYLLQQAERCADDFFVNSPDSRRCTALHHAAFNGSAEVTEALLQAGADTLLRDAEDRTPLHVAASRGQVEVARLLIGTAVYRLRVAAIRSFQQNRMAPVELWEDPQLAVQRAARQALVDYLRGLEDLWRTLVLAEDRHQFTCLHYSIRDAYAGCFQVFRLLLTSCFEFAEGRQLDEVMSSRRFQLQPGPGLLEILCSKLLDSEAHAIKQEHIRRSRGVRHDIIHHRDVEGLRPLHFAASEGNYRAVQALLTHGAELEAKAALGDAKSPVQVTAFDLAKDDTTRRALARGKNKGKEKPTMAAEMQCQHVNEHHAQSAVPTRESA
ncbi:unnamed protein product [Effrenium voratum]|nr:unnamed protein product [Effrenium voratum]